MTTHRLPCENYPSVYDVLWETSRTTNREAFAEAREAARSLCGTCILRNPERADACLRPALDRGERWAFVVTRRKLRKVPAAVRNAEPSKPQHTGDVQSKRATGKHQRNHDERLTDLRELVAQGAALGEVLMRLNVTRDALWKWCRKHGHDVEWEAIASEGRARQNQYTKRKAAA